MTSLALRAAVLLRFDSLSGLLYLVQQRLGALTRDDWLFVLCGGLLGILVVRRVAG